METRVLPCKHREEVIVQVQPTIDLLTDLGETHPQVLIEHEIQPEDYKDGLVFRSAVESIRGRFVASSMTAREGVVGEILANLKGRSAIADYEHNRGQQRFDFTLVIERDPNYFAALEVKGGEGNSINISERPIWAQEFAVWCHLDGAIVNQPSQGAHSIINRLTNEMVRRKKLVDAAFFKDSLCGTRLRPCPKYGELMQNPSLIAPDVFLFPCRAPTLRDPQPPMHDLSSLRLPNLIRDLFGVDEETRAAHVWYVNVEIIEESSGRARRKIEVRHRNKVIESWVSRSWKVDS